MRDERLSPTETTTVEGRPYNHALVKLLFADSSSLPGRISDTPGRVDPTKSLKHGAVGHEPPKFGGLKSVQVHPSRWYVPVCCRQLSDDIWL